MHTRSLAGYAILWIIICMQPQLFAQTIIEGGIYEDQDWTKENSPYIISGDVVIFPSKVVYIHPGVEVLFDGNYSIEVRGRLNAGGVEGDSVRFTFNPDAVEEGRWKGFYVKSTQGGKVTFLYSIISRAEKFLSAEHYDEDIFYLKHCKFEDNNTVVSNCLTAVIIDSCTFKNNIRGACSGVVAVYNSTFRENGTAICGCGDVRNCSFSNNDVALGGGMLVVNCSFKENGTALGGAYRLLGCTITNCEIAIASAGGLAEIIDSRIEYNGTGLIIEEVRNQPYIENSRLCHNDLNVELQVDKTYSLRGLCWCTDDSTTIEDKIIDGYDDLSLGLVNYDIFDDQCVHPIRSVIKVETGITDLKASIVKIQPNPVQDCINLQLNSGDNYRYMIYNDLGQKVLENSGTGSELNINASFLSQGVYLIYIQQEDVLMWARFVKVNMAE